MGPVRVHFSGFFSGKRNSIAERSYDIQASGWDICASTIHFFPGRRLSNTLMRDSEQPGLEMWGSRWAIRTEGIVPGRPGRETLGRMADPIETCRPIIA